MFITILFTGLTASALTIASYWAYTKYTDTTDTILVHRKSTVDFVSQSYSDSKAEQIDCDYCGGTVFYVGQDCCLTAVICVGCLSEENIHEG